jgi:hypothetical protein
VGMCCSRRCKVINCCSAFNRCRPGCSHGVLREGWRAGWCSVSSRRTTLWSAFAACASRQTHYGRGLHACCRSKILAQQRLSACKVDVCVPGMAWIVNLQDRPCNVCRRGELTCQTKHILMAGRQEMFQSSPNARQVASWLYMPPCFAKVRTDIAVPKPGAPRAPSVRIAEASFTPWAGPGTPRDMYMSCVQCTLASRKLFVRRIIRERRECIPNVFRAVACRPHAPRILASPRHRGVSPGPCSMQ